MGERYASFSEGVAPNQMLECVSLVIISELEMMVDQLYSRGCFVSKLGKCQ